MLSIKTTRDYQMFNHINGNRDINKAHVKRLLLAFGNRPQKLQWNPILVNEKMEIIDGQHRFEAAKKLEAPVYYRIIEGLTLHDCQELNSNSKMWSPNDYARAYCENGNRNYCNYLDFKKKWGLNHDVNMRYLALETPITNQSFKEGYLEVPDYKKSNLYAEYLIEVGQYVTNYKLRANALAFLQLVISENEQGKYNHKKMMTELAKQGQLNDKFTQLEEASEFWSKIYNQI